MVRRTKLDVARRALAGFLILCSAAPLLLLPLPAPAQELPSDAARIAAAQKALDSGHWEEAAQLASDPNTQSPELDLIAGVALAKLQRWNDARAALQAGRRKAPSDPRFTVELAGVAYEQRDYASAKHELHAALVLDPKDAYSREFLGTIYFIEGNLEAALKYWNSIGKPRLRAVAVSPQPRVEAALLDRAIGFNAPQVLTSGAFLDAQARLDNLEIFPRPRFTLTPASSGNYDAIFHMPQRNGWGDSPLDAALTLLSGLPYETIYPAFYDIGHKDVNITSLLRWDPEKRRAYASLSTPVLANPNLRFRVYVDGRNENWNLSSTFYGAGSGALTDLNVRRLATGAEFSAIVTGRWSWGTGFEFAYRNFRNLLNATSLSTAKPFFAPGTSLNYWFRASRSLIRIPERRFTVDSYAQGDLGRDFSSGMGLFASARGGLATNWFPKAQGDDYQIIAQVRAGDTAGDVPLDELFQLGIERDDNDLWLRGHVATTGDGRKGAAPLGRRYFLENWELDKSVYTNGFFTVKLGPFLDSGDVSDPSGLFGSRGWLWDGGALCKIRVLGTVTVVLIYGHDLNARRNIFYATAAH